MRLVRLIAVVAWLGVAFLAAAGFAAFSPDTTDIAAGEAAPSVAVAGISGTRGGVAGLVAAQAFSQQQTTRTGPTTAELSETAEQEVLARLLPPQIFPTTTSTTTSSTTTTTTTTVPSTVASTTEAVPTTTAPTEDTTTTADGDNTVAASGGVGPCNASYYGDGFAGRTTANGEKFDPSAMTAATHFVDFNTVVTVTRVDTGASVQVRINDRGPFMSDLETRHPSRCIDLSTAAMQALDGTGSGVIAVTLTMPADTNGLARLQAKYGAI